jgi:acetyl-CoA carboxylase carboxyltransferase component
LVSKNHRFKDDSAKLKVMNFELKDFKRMTKSKDKEEKEAKKSSARSRHKAGKEAIRPELAEVIQRYAFGLDANRPEAVAKRQAKNRRTARANVEDLCDKGTFIEYGALALAAQRGRRSMDDLIRKTPADGMIVGMASVNGPLFPEDKARCMVMAYDYTVLAGTQGYFNHKKTDRGLKIAYEERLPLILFGEGGGGRPGDIDAGGVAVAGLDLGTFASFAKLSGHVPVIGLLSGYCFAGNAALLGCCDVIIATRDSNIGMGGPVMIEGGGLGVFKPEEVGPMEVQTQNGVVDIEVSDDVEMVAVAKKYLSYFQGDISSWDAGDQIRLRDLIPESRKRTYDVRSVIAALADTDSFMELKPKFGPGMVTGLIRVEGRPFGVIANNPTHMAGAIEAEDADKAARLMQLCNAHGLPILSLIDTPGFMVGPEIEKRAQVRHVCRMFVVGAHVSVPYFTVVLRRGYGLGAMAMARGGFHESVFTASWPTGEFGGMGLEGAVKAGFKKELEAVEDPKEREALYEQLVAQLYEMGKAINMAAHLEIDAVIDPADTRQWIIQGLKSAPARQAGDASHSFVDPW